MNEHPYVMNVVKMRNIVQEEPALPTQNWPIHSGSSASLYIPHTIAVMGNHRISVMQIGDHNNWGSGVS